MDNIAIHEAAHYLALKHFGVASRIEGPLTIPEPHNLTLEQQLVVYSAGAVGEFLHGDRAVPLLNGCGADAALICSALRGTNPVAYATALACIVEGKNVRFVVPAEHINLLRNAVQTAKTILGDLTCQ